MKSKGFGDTVEKVAKAVGADKVAKVYEKVTGKAFVPTTFTEEEIMTATTASFAKFCTD